MTIGVQLGRFVPRLESVLDIGQAGVREFRVVAQNDGLQVGPVDPAQSFRRVDVLVVVVGVEPVSLQAAADRKSVV